MNVAVILPLTDNRKRQADMLHLRCRFSNLMDHCKQAISRGFTLIEPIRSDRTLAEMYRDMQHNRGPSVSLMHTPHFVNYRIQSVVEQQ